MWLQPPLFSIIEQHFGQFLVCLLRYSYVSSQSFFFQLAINSQSIGSCGSSPQLKQMLWPHLHVQSFRYANKSIAFMAKLQPGPGHQRNWFFLCYQLKSHKNWLIFCEWVNSSLLYFKEFLKEALTRTKLCVIKCLYFCRIFSSVTNSIMVASSITIPHFGAGQKIESASP